MSKPILTSDGSHTLFNAKTGEHYHSTFGAVTESEHIFIRAGLDALPAGKEQINILEIGLGTGLNALLAFRWAEKHNRQIDYFAVEAFPIEEQVVSELNYSDVLGVDARILPGIHGAKNKKVSLSDYFSIEVQHTTLQEIHFPEERFHLVFFDAFSPDTQPEMWTEACFEKIAKAMKQGGILTTYSCKGTVKRALKATGFQIEKLPGPPGKREFLRALKPCPEGQGN